MNFISGVGGTAWPIGYPLCWPVRLWISPGLFMIEGHIFILFHLYIHAAPMGGQGGMDPPKGLRKFR